MVEGQAVTLSCQSSSTMPPDTSFSWYRNGVLIHKGPSSSLQLPAATSTDAGSYHCWPQDGHSVSEPSSAAVLTVLCELPSHLLRKGGGAGVAGGSTRHPQSLCQEGSQWPGPMVELED